MPAETELTKDLSFYTVFGYLPICLWSHSYSKSQILIFNLREPLLLTVAERQKLIWHATPEQIPYVCQRHERVKLTGAFANIHI